jgi:hypothetical protein
VYLTYSAARYEILDHITSMSNSEADAIQEWMIPRCPLVEMSGDILLLHLDNVVPGWETYEFALHTEQPGEKVSLKQFFPRF